jgi:transcription termination factor Rho
VRSRCRFADRFAARMVRARRSSRSPPAHDRTVNIAELKRKSIPQLHDLAESLELPSNGALDRQALIFRIEQKLLDQSEILVGEGVLEVLPEGYGFLRSQDWN